MGLHGDKQIVPTGASDSIVVVRHRENIELGVYPDG